MDVDKILQSLSLLSKLEKSFTKPQSLSRGNEKLKNGLEVQNLRIALKKAVFALGFKKRSVITLLWGKKKLYSELHKRAEVLNLRVISTTSTEFEDFRWVIWSFGTQQCTIGNKPVVLNLGVTIWTSMTLFFLFFALHLISGGKLDICGRDDLFFAFYFILGENLDICVFFLLFTECATAFMCV